MNIKALSSPDADQLLNQLLKWGPHAASALLVVAIAYATTQLIWRFTGDTGETPQPKPQVEAPAAQSKSKAAEYGRNIAGMHLFGEAEAKPGDGPVDAPETQLNLSLLGILAIGEEDGLAIIASGNQDEKVYSVGDSVPGNATLKAVYIDRVLLESSRGLETLKLPKEEGLLDFESPEEPGESRGKRAAAAESGSIKPETLREYRREFVRNPASLAEIAQVQPEQQDGEFVGYKVKPLRDDPLFNSLGLQEGDVITSVNGVDLNKPENGIRALRNLMKAKELNVTVLRDGQSTQIYHTLED